jgi:uncharacterized phage-like protein YoqJ
LLDNIKFDEACSVTGHRPHKLFGYNSNTAGNQRIIGSIRKEIIRHIEIGVDTFISGMALGIDMWFAIEVIKLKEVYPHIKLICAIPCAGQESTWKLLSQIEYKVILSKADKVIYVSEKEYGGRCMLDRDEWMVDRSRYLIAVWNGDTDGGTYHTYKYARGKKREITRIDPYGLS